MAAMRGPAKTMISCLQNESRPIFKISIPLELSQKSKNVLFRGVFV